MRNDHTVTLTLTVYLESSDGMSEGDRYNDIVSGESVSMGRVN